MVGDSVCFDLDFLTQIKYFINFEEFDFSGYSLRDILFKNGLINKQSITQSC